MRSSVQIKLIWLQGLKDASTNLGVLNRNISHILQVGKSFEGTASVWNQFCQNIQPVPQVVTQMQVENE